MPNSPPNILVIWGDDIEITNLSWKMVFMEQRLKGTVGVWFEPFTALRIPKLFNLRTDPFERADITSNTYYDWFPDHDFIAGYGTAIGTAFLQSFKEFPPRQEPASFTIDHAVAKLPAFLSGNRAA